MLFPLDNQMPIVKARGKQVFYGAPIGILQCDSIGPCIPGSARNASTFSRPVRYKTIPGLITEKILGPDAGEMESLVVDAAVELASEGAEMITSDCGFMAQFQQAISRKVDIPVLLSSLLLVPFLESMLPQERSLGIMTASARSLTPEFLSAAGLPTFSERVVVTGLDSAPAFNAAIVDEVGEANLVEIGAEVLDSARALMAERPDIGILLLECTELPPYAAEIQRATGVPVFDLTSMVEFFVGGLGRNAFEGFF